MMPIAPINANAGKIIEDLIFFVIPISFNSSYIFGFRSVILYEIYNGWLILE
jgi:hypothetical protein